MAGQTLSFVKTIAVAMLAASSAHVWGQPAEQPRPRSETDYTILQLRGDGEASKATLDRIRAMVDAGVSVDIQWLNVLMEKGQFADVETLGVKGIVNLPDLDFVVAGVQNARVEALLKQGKTEEALAAAKGFYNVCVLGDIERAVNLVARCLEIARPDDPAIVKRFKMQQVEWSNATTKPSGSSELGENILSTIKVSAEPFTTAAAAITGNDFQSLIRKGNLLLVADNASEARKAFEAAEKVSTSTQQTTEAISGIARAIRAEAGAVGPANAYILEQQQTAQ
jgi:hypothetical protein